MKVKNRQIGDGNVYVVAEIGASHNQNYQKAVALVYAAQKAGADAVKLQTFRPEDMTLDGRFPVDAGLWKGEDLFGLYKKIAMPWEWQPKLKEVADNIGIDLFSTPFSLEAVDFLEAEVNPPCYKIASPEMCWGELLDKVDATGKDVFISTGCAEDFWEISQSIRRISKKRCVPLYCTWGYPSKPKDVGLMTIPALSQSCGVYVGISDHTQGIAIAIAAVAMGAQVVEKHIRLDEDSPDAAFALYPKEFENMVKGIRDVEPAIRGCLYDGRHNSTWHYRRSLICVQTIRKDEEITKDNVKPLRPNAGMYPNKISGILGKKAKTDINVGTGIQPEMVE